jgi:hypothetical protein
MTLFCIFVTNKEMKKSLIILFASFYLIIASGLTVSLHYCGGKLKEISFLNHENDKGCCGKKKMSKNCCKDKITYFKVRDSHESSHLLKTPVPSYKITDIALPIFEHNFSESVSAIILNYHAPPVIYDNPLYLKHRVLLI